MNPWKADNGEDSQLGQLYRIGSQRNPSQEADYQKLLQGSGLSGNASPTSYASDSALNAARQAQQFQVQANQPAIQSLTQQKTDLGSKYDDLLKSISSNQQPAIDAQTTATNNELARRGLTSDSGVGQQQLAGALRPITAQTNQLIANTGISQQQDLGQIAAQIASLQSGNPAQALSYGQNFSSQQQQQDQFEKQLAQQIAQANKQQAPAQPERYINIGAGGLFDTATGQVVQGQQALSNKLNNGGGNGRDI